MARSTKRVPKRVLEHFGGELERWMNENHEGNQTKAAKALGCTQSHISAMIRGDRGPGLNTLIAMRDKTGRSIDALLGLPLTPADALIASLRESVEAHLLAEMHAKEAGVELLQQRAEELRARERAKEREKP